MLRAQLPSSSLQATRPIIRTCQTEPNKIDRVGLNLCHGNYDDLIQQIRSKLQQSVRDLNNHSVEPRDWIDVVLSITCRVVTLRIRKDNLYLDGYQTSNGQWLEFNRDNGETTHLIPGSTFLGFTGSYHDLENVGQTSVIGMQVSRNRMLSAINELAVINEAWLRARHLTLLIITICEATRFEEISRKFTNIMQRGSRVTEEIQEWMVKAIRTRGKQPAWEVNWEAKLIGRGMGRTRLDVTGTFKVKYCVGGVEHEIMLFDKVWGGKSQVNVGECLPLSMNVMKVPLDVTLYVEVSVGLDGRRGASSGDHCIVLGVQGGQYTIMDNDILHATAKWSRQSYMGD